MLHGKYPVLGKSISRKGVVFSVAGVVAAKCEEPRRGSDEVQERTASDAEDETTPAREHQVEVSTCR